MTICRDNQEGTPIDTSFYHFFPILNASSSSDLIKSENDDNQHFTFKHNQKQYYILSDYWNAKQL